MKNILIVGAAGQIGSELVPYLRSIYGGRNVVASDLQMENCTPLKEGGPCEVFDALDGKAMFNVVKKYNIDTIFNLVAMLSAKGEANPLRAWKVNMEKPVQRVGNFRQTKGAVFHTLIDWCFRPHHSARSKLPRTPALRPTTVYGISKVAAELLGDYYFLKYGVDARGLRYPGIISNITLPGGGTHRLCCEIFYEALKHKRFTCNLQPWYFP